MHRQSIFILFAVVIQSFRAQPCTDYDLRLVGGQVPNEGRVEICVNQQWGTVCDDVWGDSDAQVVCRQLGYPPEDATSFQRAHFGQGSGEIFLDNVGCSGTESRLIDCNHLPVGVENCGHHEDAGVHCVACQRGDIRLVGGTTDWEGRVEVCINNNWSTVCDDHWMTPDANVACRQLGYSRHNATAYTNAHFGQGNGPIGLDNVACIGSEYRLVDCRYDGETSDCRHFEDAGVHCQRELFCEDGAIRVVDGPALYEGRVEVCFNETWGTVCNDLWQTVDANVACRQLGFPSQNAVAYLSPASTTYSQGTGPIFLDNVNCDGTESRLADCNYDSHTADCTHSEDAGIRCQPQCQVGDIRLAGSSIRGRGRVEVCVNGLWGTVCDDGWGSTDALVVCKQLNYSRHNATAFSQARFGPGSIPILISNVGCSGSEEQLNNCRFSSQVAGCSHSEDASVQCQLELTCRNGDIRITGGTAGEPSIGRVEVCFNETWGTVCNDHWNEKDAIVACRQLGYTVQGAVALTTPGVSGYSQGTGPIFLDNVICIGTESKLTDCPYDSHTADCRHVEDAGVQCEPMCQNGDIRLVGGRSQLEGRVEICLAGVWGTVCDDLWNNPDAAVVCQQLGFSRFGAVTRSSFRGGSGPIHLDNVQCSGSESRLLNCPYDSHTLDCSHTEDAGVLCRPVTCSNGDVRLVGGLSEFEGRVEVCWNETWGTVCDDSWGVTDARVVCRQLGYGSANVGSFRSAHFGRGSGSIFLDDVGCSGSEQSLVNCSHRGIGNENCGHHEDAGVRCGQCIENSVRLVGGSSQYEGRVEICLSGRWGTVCDDLWGEDDARVVCRQLGHQQQGVQALSSAIFGQGTAPIVMNNVRCSGTESQLASCMYVGAPVQGCSHSEDAGVRCQNVPGSPQTVSVTSLNPSSLRVSWTPPPANQQFGPLLRYNVSCSAQGISHLYETPNNSTFLRLVTGLYGCISYSCCVSAINAVGEGTKKCRSASTREDIPSAPPRSIAAYATSPTSLFVSWNAPLLEHRNGCIRQYRIYVLERDTGRTIERLINTGTFQVTIPSLHPYYQYECKAAAITTGEGPSSQTVTTRTYSSAPSGPPQNIIVSQTSRTVSLQWNLPLSEDRNGIITSYFIRVTNVQTSAITDYATASTSYTVESLRPCTPYSVIIAARNVNGTGPFSEMHQVQTAEDVPSGPPQSLSLQTSNSTLHLSWSPPLSENCQIGHYKINITELDTGMILLLNTTGSTSITVPSLHPFYRYSSVIAAFTIGVGPYTLARTIRLPEWKPSGSPQHFEVSGFSNNFVSLSWSSPRPEHRNGIITGYVISVTLEDTGASSQFTSQTTQLTVESLVPNGLYVFAVAAQTSVGTGPFSMTIMQRTNPSLPSSPQDFTVTTVSNSSTTLHLNWSPPEFPNGDILDYNIRITEQQTGEQSEYTSISVTLTVFQLHPYYTYNCRVAAINSAGLGQFTTIVSQTTPQDIPGPPRGLTTTPSCPPSITLNWSPPLPSERNGIITSYRIDARTVERVQMFQWTTSSTSYSILDAAPYTTYIFQVAASTVAGQGAFSEAVNIKTCETHPTHAPLNITEEARGATSFQISWSPPPDEHHNGIIRYYTVNVTETETGRKLPTFTTESTQITVTNLHPYYIYSCAVAAVTVAESPHSATIGVQTREAAPSGPPVNLNAVIRVQDPYSVYLDWSPPDPAQRNGIIRSYEISIIRADNTQGGSDLRSTINNLNVEALRPFTTYRYKVAAYTVALGPYTAENEVTTPQAPPTAPPQGVSAEPQGPTTLLINWQPPPVEHRNGIIVGYTILVTEILTGMIRELSTGGTAIQITVPSLHPFYSYNCSVAATTVGRGPFSPNFTAVLPETSPGAPRNPRHTVLGGTSCQLTWEPPRAEDQNGIIRRYMIVLVAVNSGTRYELEADTTSKLLDFLRPFTEYQYKVAAVTVSIGDYTDLMNFTTLTIPPEAVRNLTIAKFEHDPTTIVLTWLPPLQTNGDIQGYNVNVTGLTQPESLTYFTIDTTITVTFLHPYYLYQCAVAARTSAGSGHFNLQAVQLPEDVPSGPPLNLMGSPQNSRTLQLSWQAPLFEHRNGVVRKYRINVTELETGLTLPQQTSTVTSITVQSLHPYYRYNCSVAAYTNGVGPYDSIVRQMPSDVPTSPPQTFINESILPTSVTFSWAPPPPEHHNGLIVEYVIRVVVIDTGELFEVLTESSSTTLVYDKLRPDSAYNFSIAAMTEAVGTGPFTDNITVITPPGVPTDAPQIKAFVRISATSMRISWQPLTPEESRGVVSMYHVKYRPLQRVTRRSLDDMSLVINTTDLVVTIPDLDPRVTYAVAIAASTSAGMGNYSSETVIELFSNSLFQLHLTGAILCQEWLRDRRSESFTDLSQDMARKLEDVCSCALSAKYIGDGRLYCNEDRTGTVILQARMISTEIRDSASILSTVQQWVQTSPTLVTRGVQLTVVANCSVELAEFNSSLGCVQLPMVPQPSQQPTAPPTTQQPTAPRPTDMELGEAKATSSIPIPAIAGAAGGIIAVIIIIVILAVVVHKKRKSKRMFRNLRQPAIIADPLPTGELCVKPPAAAAVDPWRANGATLEAFRLPMTADSEDHIYEPIPAGSPAGKYENRPLPIPQDSKMHEYDTTSHTTKPTQTTYDYANTGRRDTTLPEEAPASSKANGYAVPRRTVDEPQKASNAGEGYAKLDVGSFPPLQCSTFGPSGAVPNPYEELPTQPNLSYGQFGASDSSGSDSRPEGQERSRNEEEYIEMHRRS